MNRINIICLGVKDMEASLRFYRDGLGFETEETENNPAVVFFNTEGTKFELFPLDNLVEDIGLHDEKTNDGQFNGVTLSYNVREKYYVEEVIQLARHAGAIIVKEPQEAFWGGYHAYFKDLDGYYWEVAWGPEFKFNDKDMLEF